MGICTAKLSEAEALFAEGIDRILMTTGEPAAGEDSPRDGVEEALPGIHPGG